MPVRNKKMLLTDLLVSEVDNQMSALCRNLSKKNKSDQVHRGSGFPAKDVSVRVSEESTLTPDTLNLQYGT
jgi:hypothetical protein